MVFTRGQDIENKVGFRIAECCVLGVQRSENIVKPFEFQYEFVFAVL
jgi:hypothetical protein